MLIQRNSDAERRARVLVAGWPQVLRDVGALRVRKATRVDTLDPEADARQRLLVSQAVEDWAHGEILVLEPRVDRLDYDQMKSLVGRLSVTPDTRALAFSIFPTERDDLSFLWDRACLSTGERHLALVTWNRQQGEVGVSGRFRSASVDLIQPLGELPVVSAELLRGFQESSQDHEDAPAYRWSNRVANLRRSGLLLPLDQLTDVTTAVRAAHAEAVGRPLDQRPTRLYRSLLYDLRRAYRS